MIVELQSARAQRATAMIDGQLPAGCDYPGRHQPRPFVDTMPAPQPMPAEACTELGDDDDDDDGTRGSMRLGLVIVATTGVPFLLALVSWVMSLMPTGIAQP